MTGVQVKGASFINNGDILMGKDDVSLSGGREDDTGYADYVERRGCTAG